MSRLIDSYDAVLFDLDGVIYLGPVAVDGAVAAMAELDRTAVPLMYVTNNAARSADTVVAQLQQLGYAASLDEVLTSAQVAAVGIAELLPQGSPVLVAGSSTLAGLLADQGLVPVFSADDQPVAVVQGYEPRLPWPMLDEVCLAIQGGAVWYATNDDASRPTERGLVPGAGAMIAAIQCAIGGEPVTFGKPFRPMLDQARARLGAQRPIFVGDRLDTDIEGAVNAGMASLLVFSGAHGKADLIAADAGARPDHIGADVGALLRPARRLMAMPDGWGCGDQRAVVLDGAVVITTSPDGIDDQFDALWAVAHLSWNRPDLQVDEALERLDMIG